jgi:hypothetical protein
VLGRLAEQYTYAPPCDQVFKRNHGPFLHFKHEDYRLEIVLDPCQGQPESASRKLCLNDLDRFDQQEVVATLQAS